MRARRLARGLFGAAVVWLAVGAGRAEPVAPAAGRLASSTTVVVSSDLPHDAMPADQLKAWVSSGVAGIPPLMDMIGRVNWAKFAEDDCGEEYTGSLLQITREMANRSAACARTFNDALKSTTTASKVRYGIMLGLAGAARVPPVLYDGLVSRLSDESPEIRMRASEILARSGFRQAAPAIKAAMHREPVASTRNRMSYHLYLLGDPAGDPQALRK